MAISWGLEIKRLREERGLTQSELARKSGLGPSHISRIEAGAYTKPEHRTIECLGIGLNMTVDMLIKELRGESSQTRQETPIELLRRASATMPIAYPVCEDFDLRAGVPVDMTGQYHYIEPARAAGKNIQVFKVHGHCLEPMVSDGNWVAIDLDGSIEAGDIVVYLGDDELCLGKARSVEGELWFENSERKVKYQDCQAATPVIEIIRRLK